VGVSYELYPPEADAPYTWTGNFDDGAPTNYGLLWGTYAAYLSAYGIDPDGDAAPPSTTAARGAGVLDNPPNNNWDPRDQPPLIQNESVDDLIAQYDQGARFNRYHGGVGANNDVGAFSTSNMMGQAAGSANPVVRGVTAMVTIRRAGLKSQQIMRERCWTPPCSGGDGGGDGGGNGGGDGGGGTGGDGGGAAGANGGPGTGGAGGKAGGSRDPNDKLGPSGIGADRFIVGSEPARYTIRFENIATTNFPAQEVVIVDTLDTAVFDPATFSLGAIAFGDRLIQPPPGLQAFTTEVDLAPALPASVLINARFDPANGRAVWTFATLDPATRDLPEDGLVGFLPPNVTSPEGEGSVGYTVALRPDLPTGTRIANRAEIVFDINAPIVTPAWVNTIDAAPPATRVDPLPPTSTNPLAITVTGTDAGTGIQQYALFVAEGDGPFLLYDVRTEPAFVFEGEVGQPYRFFSVGSDFVLNVEGPKNSAEETTAMVVSSDASPDLPAELTLGAPFPNPLRSLGTVRLGLPSAGLADVRVYDLLGREVARVAEGELAAGWHVLRLAPGALASGSYVLRAQTDEAVRTQRFVVVR
jgi:hypothetical protein